MKIQNLVLIAGLTAVAAFAGYDYFANSSPRSRPAASSAGSTSARVGATQGITPAPQPQTPSAEFIPSTAEGLGAGFGLAVQTSNEGQVEVTVTPGDLSSNAKTWDFTVSLNTHSVELSEDLAQASVLIDEHGDERRPLSWTGAPPGGHHREGVLSFEPVSPRPSAIKLEVRGVGGVGARTFSWLIP